MSNEHGRINRLQEVEDLTEYTTMAAAFRRIRRSHVPMEPYDP